MNTNTHRSECRHELSAYIYTLGDFSNILGLLWSRSNKLYDNNTSASSFHHTASSVQLWWTTDHLSNAPTIQLILILILILMECQTFSFVHFNSIHCFFHEQCHATLLVGRLVDIGCSSRCILRRSSYISETLLLVLLKLLFIVWLFPVGHLWSSIVLKKQHKTKPPKTVYLESRHSRRTRRARGADCRTLQSTETKNWDLYSQCM